MEMNQLKKMLAGLSIASLIAGSSLAGAIRSLREPFNPIAFNNHRPAPLGQRHSLGPV